MRFLKIFFKKGGVNQNTSIIIQKILLKNIYKIKKRN